MRHLAKLALALALVCMSLRAAAAGPCQALAAGQLADGAPLEPALAQAYGNDDGACLARVSIAMLARHQNRGALTVAQRAREVASSDPLTYLAGGLADAAALSTQTARQGRGVPQQCDGSRLAYIVDALAVGAFVAGEDASLAKAVAAACEDLAVQCADPGTLLALASAVAVAHPDMRTPLLGSFRMDQRTAGLTGAIIDHRAALEVAGTPVAVPVQVRRAQYRWFLTLEAQKDPRFMARREGQLLARALNATDSALVHETPAYAGLALDDLLFIARIGGVQQASVMATAGDWIPLLAQVRLGSVERAALAELERLFSAHQSSPPIALLASKIRQVVAAR